MDNYEKIYVKSGYELEDKPKETDHIPYREVHIQDMFIVGVHPKIKQRSNLNIFFDGGTSPLPFNPKQIKVLRDMGYIDKDSHLIKLIDVEELERILRDNPYNREDLHNDLCNSALDLENYGECSAKFNEGEPCNQ